MRNLIAVFALLLLSTPVARAASVTLTWDHNTESDLRKYKVYFANLSGNTKTFAFKGYSTVPAGTNVKTFTGLSDVQKWYFRVTASNDVMESYYSNAAALLFIRTPTGNKFQKIEIR